MAKKPNVKRSGERLIRLAYELERLSVRLRLAGHESEANSVRAMASTAGNVGRELNRKTEER
jgi:hypothetical protein